MILQVTPKGSREFLLAEEEAEAVARSEHEECLLRRVSGQSQGLGLGVETGLELWV